MAATGDAVTRSPTPRLDLWLLGGCDAALDGRPIRFKTRRTTALVVYLAAHPAGFSREHLARVLCADAPDAAGNLRVLLSNLRRTIPDHLVADRTTVRLGKNVFSDVRRLERAVAAGRAGERAIGYESAVELYTGDLLDGFEVRGAPEFALWLDGERQRVRSLALEAMEYVAMAALRDQRVPVALSLGARMVSFDRTHEPGAQVLMRALAVAGRRSEALALYDRCRQAVEGELGVPLLPETTAVAAALRHGDLAPPIRDAGSVQEAGGPADGQPRDAAVRGAIGRDGLVRQSLNRLGACILTLTGRGGVGKSRLAVEVVRASGRAPAVVKLAPLDSVDAAATEALNVLGVDSDGDDPWSDLARELAARSEVLVLDGAEHLGPGFGTRLTELRDACPSAGLVVTSRAPLHTAGERVVPVPPLPVPAGDEPGNDALLASPAVELFLTRAFDAGHPEAASDLAAVAAICQRLDGLPLAVELAVPLLSVLSPSGLRERLDSDETDVISLLAPPPGSDRHGLAETVAWSYDLLSPSARALFRRLSVFEGAFDVDAATQVAANDEIDPLAALAELAELNMVEKAGSEEPDGLFRLPHTIRDAGRRLLREMRETNDVRVRHSRYVADLARGDSAGSSGPNRVEWLTRISARLPDIKAAIRRLSDGAGTSGPDPIATALEIVTDLGPFWLYSGNVLEGTHALTRLQAARPDAPRASLARQWIARLAVEIHDDRATARQSATAIRDEMVAADGEDRGEDLVRALSMLGHVLNLTGDIDEARAVTERAIEHAHALRSWQLPELLDRASLLAAKDGRDAEALRYKHEAYEVARQLGDAPMVLQCQLGLLQLPGHESLGLHLPSMDELLRRAYDVGDHRLVAWILASLGAVAVFSGELDDAARWFHRAADHTLRTGYRQGTGFCLMGTAAVAFLRRDPLFAARVHGAVVQRLPQLRREAPTEYVVGYEALMANLADAVDPAAFEAAVRAGSGLAARSVLTEARTYLEGLIARPGGGSELGKPESVIVDIDDRPPRRLPTAYGQISGWHD